VLKELDGYHDYIVDANFRDALSWWHKEEGKISKLMKHNLGIVTSQNQNKENFFIVRILISLCKCCF
jgi:hypothetical protein